MGVIAPSIVATPSRLRSRRTGPFSEVKERDLAAGSPLYRILERWQIEKFVSDPFRGYSHGNGRGCDFVKGSLIFLRHQLPLLFTSAVALRREIKHIVIIEGAR